VRAVSFGVILGANYPRGKQAWTYLVTLKISTAESRCAKQPKHTGKKSGASFIMAYAR